MSRPDKRPVHVAEIKKTYKGKVHVSTYVRRTFREGGKVKHETVANISDLPADLIAVIKNRLATSQLLVGDGGTMTIYRSLPHGNAAAVLGTMRNIGLVQLIAARPCCEFLFSYAKHLDQNSRSRMLHLGRIHGYNFAKRSENSMPGETHLWMQLTV